MKNQAKPLHIIEAERKERTDLIDQIKRLTGGPIPQKIVDGTDQVGAVRFKEVAYNARKLATSSKPTLEKLRAAYNSIEGYYRERT